MKSLKTEGILSAYSADMNDGSAKHGCWLRRPKDEKTFDLKLSPGQRVVSGARAKVTGKLADDEQTLTVESLEMMQSAGPSLAYIGEQRVLGFLINGCADLAATQDAFFGEHPNSLNHYYRYMSRGAIWFTGRIINVQIQMPTTCDPPAFASRAVQAALAQGIDIEGYTTHVYMGWFNCPWAGLGGFGNGTVTPGGTHYGSVWCRGGAGPVVHEVGHRFGMAHATLFNPYMEYGDKTCLMGGGGRELNAPHRLQMGWPHVNVVDVSADGTFTLGPLEVETEKPQVLRIPKPDTNEWFFVSYRQPIGPYDGSFWETLVQGASIHIWSPPEEPWGHITKFIDTSPESQWQGLDAPLPDGGVYAQSGVMFEQLSHDSQGVTVRIRFGATPPPPPPPPPPALEISPAKITLRANESEQFTANRPAVQWALSGLGIVSQSGLYTAPPRISRKTTATVTAISGSERASATVSLQKGKGG